MFLYLIPDFRSIVYEWEENKPEDLFSSFGGGAREQRQDLSAFEKSNQAGGSKFSPI